MFTSDNKQLLKATLKTALIYLGAALFTALFGGIYEIFSHGVYSGYMLYAFAFPLAFGVLPFLLLSSAMISRPWLNPGPMARYLYHCGVLTLTTGSLLTGVLEIYGTTNQLMLIYWLAGGILLLSGIVLYIFRLFTKDREKPERI